MPFDEGLPNFGEGGDGGNSHDPGKIAEVAGMIVDAYEALAHVISEGEGVCPGCTNHAVILKLVLTVIENTPDDGDLFMKVLTREVERTKKSNQA